MRSPATPLAPRAGRLAVATAVLTLAFAAPSAADTFDDVFKDFAADGQIDPCEFSTKELNEVRDDVPPDIEQYAPDFPAALTLAIEARGKGNCAKAKEGDSGGDSAGAGAAPATPPAGGGTPAPAPGAAPSTPAPPAGTPTPTPQPAPAPLPAEAAADGAITRAAQAERASGRSDDLPAAVVGVGVLAALLALMALLWLLVRAFAWEPAWGGRVRHACEEAGWRASGTWADFTDWIRLGR